MTQCCRTCVVAILASTCVTLWVGCAAAALDDGAAIEAGISLNVESLNELQRIDRMGKASGIRPRVALRVNPDFELKSSGMRMGGGARPFGIDSEQVPGVLEQLKTMDLDFRGLHIFSGSQNLRPERLIEAQNATFELACRIAPEVPDQVLGDPGRLRQVMINLMGNAVKFTTKGEVRLRVRMLQTESHGEQIQFEVIDTGIGIPEPVQSRIFERFLQADDSVQRRYGGTGLGTAIAKRLVDLMGGQIGVESEELKGSRFWFHIPLVPAENTDSSVTDSCDDASRQQDEPNRLNVLVTDDCRLNRRVMKAMLDDMGVDSDFASSGPMALEKLRDGVYDLLVLDIQMPGMSGFDVIELYQSRNTTGKLVPILVVTGDATAEIYDRCDELGVSQFLLKPVDHEKLRHALATLVPPTGGEANPGLA